MLRPLYEQADAATADRLVAGVADELDVAEVGEPVASPQLCNLFLLRS
jgi:hypothetical protein